MQSWHISGRLNIRQNKQSDTINIRWQQDNAAFEINLNALGLGNTRISGNEELIRIEKNGDAPVFANNLDEISASYIGYVFPLEHLQYWV